MTHATQDLADLLELAIAAQKSGDRFEMTRLCVMIDRALGRSPARLLANGARRSYPTSGTAIQRARARWSCEPLIGAWSSDDGCLRVDLLDHPSGTEHQS